MYDDLYTRRGHYQKVKTFQIRLWERNCYVRIIPCVIVVTHIYLMKTGMHISNGWITSPQNAYTPPMHTEGTLVCFLKILKQLDQVPSSILYTPEKPSNFVKRSRGDKKHNVSLICWPIIKIDINYFKETCQRCGYMSSNSLCKACTLLEGLERGIAEAGIVS